MKKKTYSKEDYNSYSGMLTSVWGPTLWHFLHLMSFNYPVKPTPEDKKNYKNFILNLQKVLPCKYCRINLKDNLKSCCFGNKCFQNREEFSKFIYRLHCHVNKMLGKNCNKNYQDLRDEYENFRARCKTTQKRKSKKESGCVKPFYGKKSKCLIRIVPKNSKAKTFKIDKQCLAYKI